MVNASQLHSGMEEKPYDCCKVITGVQRGKELHLLIIVKSGDKGASKLKELDRFAQQNQDKCSQKDTILICAARKQVAVVEMDNHQLFTTILSSMSRNMDVLVKMLLAKGVNICLKEVVANTLAYVLCTWLYLCYHHGEDAQNQCQDERFYYLVLKAIIQKQFFHGFHEWTSDDKLVDEKMKELSKNYKVQRIHNPCFETLHTFGTQNMLCDLKNNTTPFHTLSLDTGIERITSSTHPMLVDILKILRHVGEFTYKMRNIPVYSIEKLPLIVKIDPQRLAIKWNNEKIRVQEVSRDENEFTPDIAYNTTCLEKHKLLPSKTAMMELYDTSMIEVPYVEEYFSNKKQSTLFKERLTRLETLICMETLQHLDWDMIVDAGFYFTGESLKCFSCFICIYDMQVIDDPWMEHTKMSPGCAYLRMMKGGDYICSVLEQSLEENGGNHSENHPVDMKEKRDLTVQKKKFMHPPHLLIHGKGNMPDIEINPKEARTPAVLKYASLGRLKLFDNVKMGLRFAKETLEIIRSLPEQSCQTHRLVYRVQDVMSRLSSYRLWPHRNIRTGPLVEAGFSCKDPQTATVKCTACGLELNASTLNGTTPLEYHKKNSPDCEFFNQPNSGKSDGGQSRTSAGSSNIPALSDISHSATASADPQLSVESMQTGDTLGGDQSRNNQTDTVTTPPGHNDRNICMDNAPSNNGRKQTDSLSPLLANNAAVSSDPLVAERPRTGEVFDRTALAVPNNNNVTSSGEAVREIENTIVGAEGGNAPYPIRNARYTEQNARRESYTHWPHRNAHDIDRLVNAGFFYTGAEDIVRCFYCDIGLAEWNADDDPWIEHARHSPECPYLRDQKGQDYINNIQTQWAKIYTPKHPQHSQLEERRRTFRHENWPRDNVLQSPEQLAAAGFFYTGEGDTVRCHYCDGGLREWEPADDPWVEHARWFPFCKFVLKIKGIDFIQASATGNPGNGLQVPAAPPVAPRANEPPQALSFVDTCRIKEQRNPMCSAAAQSLKTMGYSRTTIRWVINSYIAETGRRDFKATELMDIIMRMEDAGQQLMESDGEDDDDEIGATASKAAAGGCDEEMELTPAAMKKENEYLKKKFKCMVCDQNERCIVFVPCGHRITCQRCGEKASSCAHCNRKIEQRYRTFLG